MIKKKYEPVRWYVVFVIWNEKERVAVISTNKRKIEEYAKSQSDPALDSMSDLEERPLTISPIRRFMAGAVKGPTKTSLMDSFPNQFPWKLKDKNKIRNLDK